MSGRALVANGDVTSLSTWSGIPYFFLQAGLRNGLFARGVSLHPERLRGARLLWNATRPFVLQRPGGFQYTAAYLSRLWEQAGTEADEWVSHFPLLPPHGRVEQPVSYYIDATLQQNFEDYGFRRIVSARVMREALARERDAYQSARFVVCMSRWAAASVRAFYEVPEERIQVVLPGANVEEEALPSLRPWSGSLSPLRLGFIGKEWERKGGPALLDAATLLTKLGHQVEVVVIGVPADALPTHPALRPAGFVDKRKDLPRFVELLSSLHFGCLLSRVEALGISTLECLRMGVPVIGTKVGGIPDAIPEGAGLLVPAERTAEHLADKLDEILREPHRYATMRDRAAAVAPACSWARTAAEFKVLLERA